MTMLFPKTRDEWLKLRHAHTSSTESPALFGLSPYMTAYELGVMKQRPEPDPEFEANERMRWGIRLQHAIARGIGEEYGVKVRSLSGYATHSFGHVRMGASFDYEVIGVATHDDGNKVEVKDALLQDLYEQHGSGILEIKNVDGLIFRNEWKTDEGVEPPAHIEVQVQHQLACCAKQWAAIGVLVGGNDLHLLTRLRDNDVIKAIENRSEQFWRDLAAGILPPVTLPADADIISKVYRVAEPGKLIDAQPGAADEGRGATLTALFREYKSAAAAEKAATEAKDTAKAKVLLEIQNAERVLLPGGHTISATTVAECEIPAYTRKSYRLLRFTESKPKAAKKSKSDTAVEA